MSKADEAPKVARLIAPDSESKLVLGEVEHFIVVDNVSNNAEMVPAFMQTARIDTGATTTSMHATDIVEFERDGEAWVRFTTTDDSRENNFEIERPLVRMSRIKRRGSDEHMRRPVVTMQLALGDLIRSVEVNLTDRTDFDYPLLIGRNFLRGYAVVDVSLEYTQPVSDEFSHVEIYLEDEQ